MFPRVGFIVTNMTGWSKKVVKFYNGRGTAEQWIKEGKYAVKWTRLSCRNFRDNQARLQLFALAYNLGNFLRRLALPSSVRHWSLTTLREKLIKIGAKVVRHSKYVIFQMAEVAVPRELFASKRSAVCNARMASFQTDFDRMVCQTLAKDEPLALWEAVDSLQEPPRRVIPLHQDDRRLPVSSLAAIIASQKTSILAALGWESVKEEEGRG